MVTVAITIASAAAPKHLSERSRRAWREIVRDFDLRELHHLEILQLGLDEANAPVNIGVHDVATQTCLTRS